jgi:hypothetical protein
MVQAMQAGRLKRWKEVVASESNGTKKVCCLVVLF